MEESLRVRIQIGKLLLDRGEEKCLAARRDQVLVLGGSLIKVLFVSVRDFLVCDYSR